MKKEKKGKVVQIQRGGRITIPKDLRENMDIRDGDFVVLSLRKARVVEIEEAASEAGETNPVFLGGERNGI